MSFGINLKKIRQDNNLTQEELAKKINTSRSNIANYENDKNMPSVDILEKLSKELHCSADYLMGITSHYNPKEELEKSKIIHNYQDNINKQYYMCPVYGCISAGIPNWAEECIEGRLPIDPVLFDIVNPEDHFFLRVNGESMNKVIRNGAFALIHKQDIVENGEIAVLLVNGDEATLKKFTKHGEVVVLEPMSSDNSFQTQIYDKTTPIKILGKYIGKFEMNK